MAPEEFRQRIREIELERIRPKNPEKKRRLAHERRKWERMLSKAKQEEVIIQEMNQLRCRLRESQKDLLKTQKTNR